MSAESDVEFWRKRAEDTTLLLEIANKTIVDHEVKIGALLGAIRPFARCAMQEMADRWLRKDSAVVLAGDFRGPFDPANVLIYGDFRHAGAVYEACNRVPAANIAPPSDRAGRSDDGEPRL